MPRLSRILVFQDSEEVDVSLPVKELVAKGMDDYAVGKYFTSLEYFQEILDRYPFTPEATLAELKAADCNYFLEHYPEALVLYQEFEEKHPTNEAMPYVMYQKAMCNYKRIDRVDRDVSGAEQAIQLFGQLIRAYPDSPYTEEAQARIKAARDFLANHEYFVVEFYLRKDKLKEAEIRLKHILAMYPDSTISPRAKDLLSKIQEGNAPKSDLSSWFPKMSMPELVNLLIRQKGGVSRQGRQNNNPSRLPRSTFTQVRKGCSSQTQQLCITPAHTMSSSGKTHSSAKDTSIALTGQTGTHRLHPVHFCGSKMTSIEGRLIKRAPAGQMPVQAPHWKHFSSSRRILAARRST